MFFIIITIILLLVFIIKASQLEREIPYRFHNDYIDINDVNFKNCIRNLIDEENTKVKR